MQKNIGNEIKKLRFMKGYTQSDLAKLLFVSPQAISKWEKNETVPNFDTVHEICKALGVTPNILLGYQEEIQSIEKQVNDCKELIDHNNIKHSSLLHSYMY